MTEAEWLTANDPVAMWFSLGYGHGPRDTVRQARCFIAALIRPRILNDFINEEGNRALESLYWWVDARPNDAGNPKSPPFPPALACRIDIGWPIDRSGAPGRPRNPDRQLARMLSGNANYHHTKINYCDLIRDIFGNPFRSVTFFDSWRSETVVALATGIYTDRAFDRMPILADALQEAGCDHADILAHCRGSGPHVRGCWVVDLVLGKE